MAALTTRRLLRLIPLLLVLVAGASGCAQLTAGRGAGTSTRAGEDAAALLAKVKADRAAGNLEVAGTGARALITGYPAFAAVDEAKFVAGEIAAAQKRDALAAQYFDGVTADTLSAYRGRAFLEGARAYTRLGQYERAAERLLQMLDAPAEKPLRAEAEAELRALVDGRLTGTQLTELVKRYPRSPLGGAMSMQLARAEYARGEYESAYQLLADYIYEYPEGTDVAEARRLLRQAGELRDAPRAADATAVKPGTVGVLLPVTGPGSLYGRYFDEGVTVALEEHNAAGRGVVRVTRADTKGDPVSAVKAVRRLVLEDGAACLMGSVFTMSTVAAAIESNAWGVPLLSPFVSADGLLDIGQWVFQTRVPMEVEASAVAALAATRLMVERVAIIAPSRGTGRDLAILFRDEIRRLGRNVVAVEFYEEGATDFRDQLETVREAAPDAIFAPGSIEELLLLLPQVKFYDLQIQLLGLSNWNSEKLLRLSRAELEGAVFPVESYRGKDQAAYEALRAKLTERGAVEIHPVTVSAYFGTRLLLSAVGSGATSREDIRRALEAELRQGAEGRISEARTLPFVRVRGGRPVDFDL